LRANPVRLILKIFFLTSGSSDCAFKIEEMKIIQRRVEICFFMVTMYNNWSYNYYNKRRFLGQVRARYCSLLATPDHFSASGMDSLVLVIAGQSLANSALICINAFCIDEYRISGQQQQSIKLILCVCANVRKKGEIFGRIVRTFANSSVWTFAFAWSRNLTNFRQLRLRAKVTLIASFTESISVIKQPTPSIVYVKLLYYLILIVIFNYFLNMPSSSSSISKPKVSNKKTVSGVGNFPKIVTSTGVLSPHWES
jgi:hypothetical protein